MISSPCFWSGCQEKWKLVEIAGRSSLCNHRKKNHCEILCYHFAFKSNTCNIPWNNNCSFCFHLSSVSRIYQSCFENKCLVWSRFVDFCWAGSCGLILRHGIKDSFRRWNNCSWFFRWFFIYSLMSKSSFTPPSPYPFMISLGDWGCT